MQQRDRMFALLVSVPFILVTLASPSADCQQKPALLERDRIRLAEAFRLGDELGNLIWSDWNRAPFAVLLITPEYEYLIRHPKPSSDFTYLHHDPLLQSGVYVRKRILQPNLLASFPAVSGVSTIVVGQAENTNAKSSTRWILAMLHEHFHQLQASQPSYYSDVEALNLSGGDQTGMWMLNYPFPYESTAVNQRFSSLCRKLSDALEARRSDNFEAAVNVYRQAREEFRKVLTEADYRYFSFQVWQEGVARYTEYRIAELAAESYRPGRSFSSLPDYTPYQAEADILREGIPKALPFLSLAGLKRVAFYPFGAAEALLLDVLNPVWRSVYFKEKFYLEAYFRN